MKVINGMVNAIMKPMESLFGNILYGILVKAPLYILNALYSLFKWVCGKNLGEMFFGAKNGSLEFNSAGNEIIKWILIFVVIGVVACVVFFIIVVVMNVNKQEKINWASKVKWPILVLTSSIVLPLSFILLSGLASALFTIIGGNSSQSYLLKLQVNSFANDLNSAINHLKNLTEQSNIVLDTTLPSSPLTTPLSIDNTFIAMNEVLSRIAEKAGDSGLTNIQEQSNSMMDIVADLQSYFGNGRNSLFNQDLTNIQNIINNWGNWFDSASDDYSELASNSEVYNGLANSIDQINLKINEWIELINGFTSMNKTIANLSQFNLIPNFDITLDSRYNFNLISLSQQFTDMTKFDSINYYLLGIGTTNAASEPMPSLWNLILNANNSNQIWEHVGSTFQYQDPINGLTGKNMGVLNLYGICYYMNEATKDSFSLVIKIYQMVTGRTDSNWTGTYGDLGWYNIAIGCVSVCIAIFVMALFCLFAIRRIAEIIILTIWLVVSAVIGIADDGKNFGTIRRVVIAKMFSAIVMYVAFLISITVSDLITSGFVLPGGGVGEAFGKIFIMCGCMMGGYGMASFIGQQYGDNEGLKETFKDMKMIQTGFGAAGMVAGIGAAALFGKKGKDGTYTSGLLNNRVMSAQNMVASTKSGLTNLGHKATGNHLRSGDWKSSKQAANVQNAAVSAGFGSWQNKMGKNGVLEKEFTLDPKNAKAGDLYNQMMNSSAYKHNADKIINKGNKEEVSERAAKKAKDLNAMREDFMSKAKEANNG
ncbi:MAG: hypothetical protein Ta2E_08690 [Mycoplasmoidaceae bacterium]|nr:MAG: hypothetical protein Ta2E_08690 [Mycoplasmoidaceae bacterium]